MLSVPLLVIIASIAIVVRLCVQVWNSPNQIVGRGDVIVLLVSLSILAILLITEG